MSKEKLGWKIYFAILSLLFLFAYYDLLFESGGTVYDIGDIAISSIAFLGLFGYAFNKRIHSRRLWRIWLVVIVIWDLVYNLYLSLMLGVAQRGMDINTGELLIGFLLVIPEYVALYLYGYRSNSLWEGNVAGPLPGSETLR